MAKGSSEIVRDVAYGKYVRPAIQKGKIAFSISVKDLMQELRPAGFPSNNYPQICSSIQGKKFVEANRLRIVRTEGPPSGQSSTVVVHYERLPEDSGPTGNAPDLGDGASGNSGSAVAMETPAEKATRIVNSMRGLLKDVIAEFGGPEGYIRWVRGYDEEETPLEGGRKQ
ncbi:MAG TPA: hypothetical protein VL346_08700 [Acidobacteriaceae bacterium]|nr:hypothetical protein [Acidobacteriaceae bacterium]